MAISICRKPERPRLPSRKKSRPSKLELSTAVSGLIPTRLPQERAWSRLRLRKKVELHERILRRLSPESAYRYFAQNPSCCDFPHGDCHHRRVNVPSRS